MAVGYRVTKLAELMTYELGQIEGDIENLDETSLGSLLPNGMSFTSFIRSLKSGELALIKDTPSNPLMIRDGASGSWALSQVGQNALWPEGKEAYLARAFISNGVSGSTTSNRSSAAYSSQIEEVYTPEPVQSAVSESSVEVAYEYCFEVACSEDTFNKSVGCAFELAKTKQEAKLCRWQSEETEHGTKHTVHTVFDEPKKLVVKVASDQLGVSVEDCVQVDAIGSGVVREAFIPVVPSVQLGERLGLPTEGYYYHFYNGRLVQEYKLLGKDKWAFFATRSTHDQLDDNQGYNTHQSAILVYWKLDGIEVENQHLVYLEKQITRDELDSLNDDWLASNGIKLDVGELLAAPKQTAAKNTKF